MKRFVSIFMILCVVMMSLASPASAADIDDGWLDVLDYSNPNGSTSRYYNYVDNQQIYFDLPNTYLLTYVDLLVSSDNLLGSASISFPGTTGTTLTRLLVSVSDNQYLFRYYGAIPSVQANRILLSFDSTAESCKINFQSFRVQTAPDSSELVIGSLYVNTPDGTFGWSSQPSAEESVDFYFTTAYNDPYSIKNFSSYAYSYSYREFDYLQFCFRVRCQGIFSIICESDGYSVPLEYSYLDLNSSSQYVDSNSSNDHYETNGFNSDLYLFVTVDFTSSRSHVFETVPTLQIKGSYASDTQAYFMLESVRGFNAAHVDDPEVSFLRKIYSYLQTGFREVTESLSSISSKLTQHFASVSVTINSMYRDFNNQLTNIYQAIVGNASDADQFNDDVDQRIEELEDITDSFDVIERPPIDSLPIDLSDLGFEGQLTSFGVKFGELLDNTVFLFILLIGFIFSFVGFVLYGKR